MKDKVLLVDDEAMVLAGLKRQLRNHFIIDTALSGEEAVKQVQENGPYAVIVSDFMMPGMNGIEFLSCVKKTDPDTVRMSGDTDTFNAVDTIKNRLEPSAYFSAVTITSANRDRTGKRFQFEIKLQRSK